MIPGIGTLVNVATVLLGAGLGRAARAPAPRAHPRRRHRRARTGHPADRRPPARSRSPTPALTSYVGSSAPMLIVLGVDGDRRRSSARCCASRRGSRGSAAGCRPGSPATRGSVERHRFIEGFVVSSLVFCTGPLTILGSLNDGLGLGAGPAVPQVGPRRVRGDRVRGVLRLGRGGQRAHRARGPGRPDRASGCCWATCCRTPTSPRSPRPAGCCWSGWRCGCCGSARSRSPTCSRRWSWRHFLHNLPRGFIDVTVR